VQEALFKLLLKTKSGISSQGAVMKVSSLAECLEEFEAIVLVVDAPKENVPRMVVVEDCGTPRRAPRRLSFDSRRIQIRDTGLHHFRVF
jgi:hypothetical protein